MKIEVIPVTPFEQNCSLLCCPETGRAALGELSDRGRERGLLPPTSTALEVVALDEERDRR